MLSHRTPIRLAALALCASLTVPALAHRFSPGDFGENLRGVCITSVPGNGALKLGNRVVRSGDVLTAEQLAALSFSPADPEEASTALLCFLPVSNAGVGEETELVISLKGRRNEAPTAEDSKLETYKNLPNEGLLSVSDPESDALSFTLTRSPRRGEVILRDDGSYLYTPEKNKVGTDSFTYTATDAAGNISNEATVTIAIRKPTDDRQYADTATSDCRFEAEWLRSTGIFSGEELGGRLCFSPDRSVTRGQFLAMLMEVLDLPVDRSAEVTGFLDHAPDWLRPYLAAALRSGIIAGYPADGGVEFRPDQSIRADEAARMVQNALHFAIPTAAQDVPAIPQNQAPLTRGEAAEMLYQIHSLRRDGRDLFQIFR